MSQKIVIGIHWYSMVSWSCGPNDDFGLKNMVSSIWGVPLSFVAFFYRSNVMALIFGNLLILLVVQLRLSSTHLRWIFVNYGNMMNYDDEIFGLVKQTNTSIFHSFLRIMFPYNQRAVHTFDELPEYLIQVRSFVHYLRGMSSQCIWKLTNDH